MITNSSKALKKSYSFTINLFPNIGDTCKTCNTCCRTYGWLLKKEAKQFIKLGYPVVELNKNLCCIDSFSKKDNGDRIFDKIPLCRFYKARRCTIQKNKPLDCRLYPLKIKFYGNKAVIGVSLGCKYISNLSNKEKEKLYLDLQNKIQKMPKKDLKNYIDLMYEIYKISKPKRFWMKKLKVISLK